MNISQLQMIADELATTTREFVARQVGELAGRMKSLEERIAGLKDGHDGAPGPAGENGEPGDIGPRGEKGADGAPGKDGRDGVDGKDGAPGERGDTGPAGPQGEKGADGLPGRDGLPGVQGPAGEKGMPGRDGADGKDGRDGTLENLKALFDGERTVTLCFKDGTPIDGGVIRFDVPIYRGVFVGSRTYEKGDVVTWGGSMWLAQESTSAKPEEHGIGAKAWRLAVKRGNEGRTGKEGPRGPQGLRGEKGDRGPERW